MPRGTGIRGVTFDWWHTIAETPWPDYDAHMRRIRVERIVEAFAARGLVVEPEVLYRAYDRHTELLARKWGERVDLSGEEQIHAFLELAELDAADEDLMDALAASFGAAIRTKLPILYPHIGSTLAALKRQGYKVGLISNTGRTWGRFLRPIQDDMGIGKHFDDRIFSDELGVRKPDPRIFEAALEHLGLRPAEAVHVGDDLVADPAQGGEDGGDARRTDEVTDHRLRRADRNAAGLVTEGGLDRPCLGHVVERRRRPVRDDPVDLVRRDGRIAHRVRHRPRRVAAGGLGRTDVEGVRGEGRAQDLGDRRRAPRERVRV